MLELPQEDRSQIEGESDDNSLAHVGCTNFEFESLLEVPYPEGLKGQKLSKDQWIGALKLAKLWGMPEVAALAVEELSKFALTPAENVTPSKAQGVPSWLKEGCTAPVSNLKSTSLQEISAFGFETAFRIVWARFDASSWWGDMTNKFCTYCSEHKSRKQAIDSYYSSCSVCNMTPNGWGQELVSVAFPAEELLAPTPPSISEEIARKKVEQVLEDEMKEAEIRNSA